MGREKKEKKQRGKRKKKTGRKLFHVTDRIAFASFYRMNSINIATFIGSFSLFLSLSRFSLPGNFRSSRLLARASRRRSRARRKIGRASTASGETALSGEGEEEEGRTQREEE